MRDGGFTWASYEAHGLGGMAAGMLAIDDASRTIENISGTCRHEFQRYFRIVGQRRVFFFFFFFFGGKEQADHMSHRSNFLIPVCLERLGHLFEMFSDTACRDTGLKRGHYGRPRKRRQTVRGTGKQDRTVPG
jgi:hypothetical protein